MRVAVVFLEAYLVIVDRGVPLGPSMQNLRDYLGLTQNTAAVYLVEPIPLLSSSDSSLACTCARVSPSLCCTNSRWAAH